MNFKQKTADFFKTVFPSSGNELLLFSVFTLLYGFLATKIALGYTIIFDNRIPWDAYFSFDNRAIVMTGGGFERHPLSNYFFDWIRKIALFVSGGKMDVNFRLVLAWFSVLAISLSIVQIYKYLKNIIGLPVWLSWFIVTFFSLFFNQYFTFFHSWDLYLYPVLSVSVSLLLRSKTSERWENICSSTYIRNRINWRINCNECCKSFYPCSFWKKSF